MSTLALQFDPIYQERIWGGTKIFARQLPMDRVIGESWEMVDRSNSQSRVTGGPFDGWTLHQLIENHGDWLMGPGWPKDQRFPILVKWLDCNEQLSLQVHPPKDIALELHGEPKTEYWYVAEAVPGASLFVGLKRGVTRQQFESNLKTRSIELCVNHFPVSKGDSIVVKSGQVHAIDAGNLILEIQQNSDTTYRVYDWGRLGPDGQPRQLHLRESMRSINWDQDFVEPKPVRAQMTNAILAETEQFKIKRLILETGQSLHFEAFEQPRILSVVSGQLQQTHQSFPVGTNLLIPYGSHFNCVATIPSIILVTENFVSTELRNR